MIFQQRKEFQRALANLEFGQISMGQSLMHLGQPRSSCAFLPSLVVAFFLIAPVQSSRAQQPPKVMVLPLEEHLSTSTDVPDSEGHRERARKSQIWQKVIGAALTGYQANIVSADEAKKALDSRDRSNSRTPHDPVVCGLECQAKLARKHKCDLLGGTIHWQGAMPIKLSLWWWRVDPRSGDLLSKAGGVPLEYRADQACPPSTPCSDEVFKRVVDQAALSLTSQARRGDEPGMPLGGTSTAVAAAWEQPVPEGTLPLGGPLPPAGTRGGLPATGERSIVPLPSPSGGQPVPVVIPEKNPPSARDWGLSNYRNSPSRKVALGVLTGAEIIVLSFSIGLVVADAQNMTIGTAPFVGPPAEHMVQGKSGEFLTIDGIRGMYGAGFGLTLAWGATIGFLLTAPSCTNKP